MTEVSRIIAKMLYEQAHGASIGSGAIALNDALCENLFALYVCVLNGTLMFIFGNNYEILIFSYYFFIQFRHFSDHCWTPWIVEIFIRRNSQTGFISWQPHATAQFRRFARHH
jgi:hypothetical protein